MRTEVFTPPSGEPLTLEEAKVHLRLDPGHAHPEDALVTELITAARERCEVETSRAFVTQTCDLFLDTFPFGGGFLLRRVREVGDVGAGWLPSSQAIRVPRPPLVSVASVAYLDDAGDLVTIDPSNYRVLASRTAPGRIEPAIGYSWPATQPTSDAVQVRFVCGYGAASAVPIAVKHAIRLLVAHYYENREATAVGARLEELPEGVRALLSTVGWGRYS